MHLVATKCTFAASVAKARKSLALRSVINSSVIHAATIGKWMRLSVIVYDVHDYTYGVNVVTEAEPYTRLKFDKRWKDHLSVVIRTSTSTRIARSYVTGNVTDPNFVNPFAGDRASRVNTPKTPRDGPGKDKKDVGFLCSPFLPFFSPLVDNSSI